MAFFPPPGQSSCNSEVVKRCADLPPLSPFAATRGFGQSRRSVLLPAFVAAAAEKLSFNRDVRPILAENCFACHGPDSASRKADLRLDRREVAVKAGAIVPGKPDESEMIHRIFATDNDEVMPPPSIHKQLTAAQKEKLKAWIAAGAEYQPLWSFIPPARPALPAVKTRAGSATRSIDSSWPPWSSADCSRPPRPTAAPWPGG